MIEAEMDFLDSAVDLVDSVTSWMPSSAVVELRVDLGLGCAKDKMR
jgi:hypothetical protein